jgi:hypothetical protein
VDEVTAEAAEDSLSMSTSRRMLDEPMLSSEYEKIAYERPKPNSKHGWTLFAIKWQQSISRPSE